MIDITDLEPEQFHSSSSFNEEQKKERNIKERNIYECPYLNKIDADYLWMDSNPQIVDGARILYCDVCEFLSSRIQLEDFSTTLFIELALLSFDHALHRYENRHYRISLDGYSYRHILRLLGEKEQVEIYHFLLEKEHSLPAPDQLSIEKYGLLREGLCPTWWDRDGVLRKQEIVSFHEAMLLDMTPCRNSNLLKYPPTAKLIIKIYLTLIHELLDQDQIFPKRSMIKNRLTALACGEIHYLKRSSAFKNFLRYLLKISENMIRRQLPATKNTKLLDEEKELEAVKKRFLKRGQTLFDELLKQQENIVREKDIDELIVYLERIHETVWPYYLEKLIRADLKDRVQIMKTLYEQKNDLDRLLKEMLKQSYPLKIIALHFFAKGKKVTSSLRKEIDRTIHPSRKNEWEWLLEQPWNLFTYKALLELDQLKRKTISLSLQEVEQSRTDFEKTFDHIQDFLPQDHREEEIQKEHHEINNDLCIPEQKDEIRKIVEQLLEQPMTIRKFEQLAVNNKTFSQSLIDQINEQYFSILNDAIVILDQDQVMIDPYYIDLVKEALNEH